MIRYRFLVLLFALPLLLAGPGPVSAAPTGPLDLTAATLVAKGAGIRLELTGACDAGVLGVFNADVTQTTGRHVAHGTGFTVVTCTGEPQHATVLVTADVTGSAFGTGDALVTANLIWSCCTHISTQQTVRIQR